MHAVEEASPPLLPPVRTAADGPAGSPGPGQGVPGPEALSCDLETRKSGLGPEELALLLGQFREDSALRGWRAWGHLPAAGEVTRPQHSGCFELGPHHLLWTGGFRATLGKKNDSKDHLLQSAQLNLTFFYFS